VHSRGLRFAGYAARFDRIDNGGDIVRQGAFGTTITRAREIPVLWQHKPGVVIGTVERVQEDARGLRVIGRLQERGLGREVAEMVRSKRMQGLSFGYRVQKSRKLDGVRELMVLDLIEVSIVNNPMQPLARIHATEG
jgi:HK97 family phage prohead protease